MKVAFAHNVYNRYKTLKETIEMERRFFPDSKIYVAYNQKNFNLNYFNEIENIEFVFYNGTKHKIGCVNGCIKSIQESLKDNSDVIIFSHDDVKINPQSIDVFKKNVENILNNNSDVICRRPDIYGKNYLMMEGFFISNTAANKIFKNMNFFTDEKLINKDLRGSCSPEAWLYDQLIKIDKINIIDYKHNNNNYNKVLAENLGFYHKNAGKRGWKD